MILDDDEKEQLEALSSSAQPPPPPPPPSMQPTKGNESVLVDKSNDHESDLDRSRDSDVDSEQDLLNCTFADNLQSADHEVGREEVEPMDWDDVDPGLIQELNTCRQQLAAVGDHNRNNETSSQFVQMFFAVVHCSKWHLLRL